jgi:hypothetical protein
VTAPEAVVVAASIGGLAAFVGAVIAGGVALRNETRRRKATFQDAERQALRAQAAEVFRHMFVLQHEMEWLTWHAVYRSSRLDSQMITAYESTVHDSYPRLLGAMAVLASMDMTLYNQLMPLADRIYDTEGEVAKLIGGLGSRRKRGDSLAQLRQLKDPVTALYRTLPPEMAEAMRYAETKHRP